MSRRQDEEDLGFAYDLTCTPKFSYLRLSTDVNKVGIVAGSPFPDFKVGDAMLIKFQRVLRVVYYIVHKL